MKTIFTKYFLTGLLLMTSCSVFAQCPLTSCYPQITVLNFPGVVNDSTGTMSLDMKIEMSASCSGGYTGQIAIVKEGGGFGPTRDLDTIDVVLVPGTDAFFTIHFPKPYLTEGIAFQNEKKANAYTYRTLEGPCTGLLADPSPQIYEFYHRNCLPDLTIGTDGLLLSSEVPNGNRWYKNDILLVAETGHQLYVSESGTYILEVYLNSCHSYDTVTIEGLNYAGEALETFDIADATYTWYKDEVLIPSAITYQFTPSSNGTYKVIISYCDACRSSVARSSASRTATFYKIVTDLGVTGISDATEESVLVYPNPAKNNLHVEHAYPVSMIRLINLQGETVLATKEEVVDLSSVAAGMYFLRMDLQNGKTMYTRIIKSSAD